MVTYLNENQWNVQCHRVGDRYVDTSALFYCYLYLKNNIFVLVLLIVNVSQIYWLSCQIFGISKQALDFVRDGKILLPRWTFWQKCNLFDNTPSWKWFGPRNSAPWKSLKNKISSNIWWFSWKRTSFSWFYDKIYFV